MQHKQQCIRLVADFLGIDLTDDLLATAMEQSSHAAMARAPSKYDDHPVKLRRNEALGRPRDAGISGAEGSATASGSQVRTSPRKCPVICL